MPLCLAAGEAWTLSRGQSLDPRQTLGTTDIGSKVSPTRTANCGPGDRGRERPSMSINRRVGGYSPSTHTAYRVRGRATSAGDRLPVRKAVARPKCPPERDQTPGDCALSPSGSAFVFRALHLLHKLRVCGWVGIPGPAPPHARRTMRRNAYSAFHGSQICAHPGPVWSIQLTLAR
jgi:hypothetical protein